MQYALIDENSHLVAIMDVPSGQKTTIQDTGGNDLIFSEEGFDIDDSWDYADYVWNGESFELTQEALERGNAFDVAVPENMSELIDRLVAEKVNEKLAQIGL